MQKSIPLVRQPILNEVPLTCSITVHFRTWQPVLSSPACGMGMKGHLMDRERPKYIQENSYIVGCIIVVLLLGRYYDSL